MLKTLFDFLRVHFGLWYLTAGFAFGLISFVFALLAIGSLSLDCLNASLFFLIACALEFATAYFLIEDRIKKTLPYIGAHCMVVLLMFGLIFGWISNS